MAAVRVAAAELQATHADLAMKAAAFADVAAPPAVSASAAASATAVAAIHTQVAHAHAMFGDRLAETAALVRQAAAAYATSDEDSASTIRAVGLT